MLFRSYALRAGGQISPVFESPLGLFDPVTMGEELETRFNIPRRKLTGLMSPWCLKRLDEAGGDLSKFSVVKLMPSRLRQIAIAYAASPRSEILITYDSPVGLTVNYHVKAQWSEIGAAYDAWVATRQPPYFGTHPDARIWALAREAADPAACPVLDVGAGTGRNTLALARRRHPVDAVEMSGQFAAILRAEAAKESLPVRVLERDVFTTRDDLRTGYGLVVLSEIGRAHV